MHIYLAISLGSSSRLFFSLEYLSVSNIRGKVMYYDRVCACPFMDYWNISRPCLSLYFVCFKIIFGLLELPVMVVYFHICIKDKLFGLILGSSLLDYFFLLLYR